MDLSSRSQNTLQIVAVKLPHALMVLFPEPVQEVKVEASTVAEMLDALDARWPGMRDRLCDSTPRIRRHLNIFVEGKRAELDTGLRPHAKVYVLTAMSGG